MATARGVRFAKAFVELGFDNRKARRDMKGMRRGFSGLARAGAAAATAVTTAFIALSKAIAHGTQEASKFEQSMGAIRATFRDLTPEATRFAREIRKFGVSTNQALRLQATLQGVGVSAGIARDQAAELNRAIIRLGIDLSRQFNVPGPEAIQRLQAGIFRAESEPLEALGITLKQRNVNDALKALGIDPKEATAAQQALVRFNEILRRAQAGGAIGAGARELGTFETEFARLRAGLSDNFLALGQEVLPEVTSAFRELNEAVRNVLPVFRAVGGLGATVVGAARGAVRGNFFRRMEARNQPEMADEIRAMDLAATQRNPALSFFTRNMFNPLGMFAAARDIGMGQRARSREMLAVRNRMAARRRRAGQTAAALAAPEAELAAFPVPPAPPAPRARPGPPRRGGNLMQQLPFFTNRFAANRALKGIGRGLAQPINAANAVQDAVTLGLARLLQPRRPAVSQFSRGSAFARNFAGVQTTVRREEIEREQLRVLQKMFQWLRDNGVVFQ